MRSPIRTTFTALRLSVGIASWFAPIVTTRTFALTHSEPFLARLFGARETALAVGIQAREAAARRRALRTGLVIDVVDAVGGFFDYTRGRLSGRAAILGPGGALVFAALGVASLAEDTPETWT